MVTAATATAPQVNDQWPANGYNSPTLTPELIAAATSSDGGTLSYAFYVYDTNGNTVVSATGVTTPDWYVPSGKLAWSQTYYWTAVVSEGGLSSQAQSFALSTPVPQPLIYSGLAQNTTGPGYDQQNGNYTTQATDASVTVTGPSLSIQRSYNSADPRQSGAFGAGWSSVLDTKVTPGQPAGNGTTATEVVTYPDGQQVAFGLNADGKTYSSPQGRYSNFTAVSAGGFQLIDKSDTTYLFTQSLGSGAYGITSITDALGHKLNFTYNGSGEISQMTSAVPNRSLYLTWQAASGTQLYPHVSTVVTDPATIGTASTAITWNYTYNGDQLSTVCNESETGVPCTSYNYESGSDYPPAVLDSGPQSYWRLSESSGTTAASSVLTNEGTDNATYVNTNGLGNTTSPLAGDSTVPAVTFGSGGYAKVPRSLADEAANMSVSLWFHATSGNDVLFSESQDPITSATTTNAYAPVLYIGSDGHLLGGFNAPGAPLESTAAVDDGHWHNAVLTSAGSVQYLYVDGVQVASKTSTVSPFIQPNIYIGAGFLGGSYPDEANSGVTSTPTFYAGSMSDVATWDRPLTVTQVSSLYSAGTHAAAWATKVTQPAGNVSSQVAYDYPTSRVTSVTDANGGVWKLSAPSVSGSSQEYAATVEARDPEDYWRLGDTGTTTAVNQVHGQAATYNNVTQGATPGPFSDSTVDNFNGSTSYLALPNSLITPGNQSISLWFNAPVGSGQEVLFSSSVDSPANGNTSNGFTPNLYIGYDGNLNGEFDDNDSPMITTTPVTDGKWHNVILTANNSAGTESMYLDGKLVQTATGETITGGTAEGQDQVFVGTGFLGADWADQTHYSTTNSTGYPSYFTGDISDVAVYGHPLTAADVAAEWAAVQHSPGLTPVETVTVTQPTSSAVTRAGTGTETYRYDPDNGGRLLSQTDALGDTTSYGYDTDGFQDQVTDPNGNVTTTGYDIRGNVVSKSTCQDQAAGKCSTSYYTYWPDDTETSLAPDPRDDLLLTSRDPRSASATDNTYLTQYTYNTAGEVTTVNTPPVPGSAAAGPATDYYYTDGTTTAGDADGTTIPPKGLLYKTVTPGGAVTQTLYDQSGNVVETINPNDLVTKYAYDYLGRRTSQTVHPDDTLYPNGLETSYIDDASGNVTQETEPGVTDQVTGDIHTPQVTTNYDKDNNVTKQVTADTNGGDASRTVSYTYNSDEQKSSSTDPKGAVTDYTYDSYGNLATETDPNPSTGTATGDVTGYSYDANGGLLTSTLENYNGSLADFPTAGSLVIESRAYDPAGRLSSVTDTEGRETSYGYTDNGMVSSTTITDTKTGDSYVQEADTFDAAGNITSRTTSNGGTTTDYSVDAGDQVTAQQVDPGSLNRITSYGYDPDDHVTSETVAQGGNSPVQTTNSTYDAMGNLTTQTVQDPGAEGPAGWWPLTQGSGTTVSDNSGTGNLATASGVTWTGSGGAKLTGQSGQEITTRGPVVDTTGSFSVSVWVKLAAVTGSDEEVVTQDAGSMSGFYLGINGGSSNWGFARPEEDENDPPDWAVSSGPTATAGTWTFLTGVYNVNTGTVQLYVNGTASGSASDPSPIAANGPLEIGAEKWDGQADTGNFDGSIAGVEVYPTALSADEISGLYQQANPPTGPSTGNFGGDITRDALTTTYQLDKLGQVTAKTDPDGVTATYAYDEAGRQATVTEPQIAVQNGSGGTPTVAKATTATGYDTFGDVTETRDENGNVTDYAYDLDGRQTSETLPPYTPPSGSSSITAPSKTTYDYLGQVTKATDPLGNATTYSYDQLGDQVSQLDPDTTVPITTTYDGDGEPLSQTDATGAETTATYDYLGRQLTSTQVERNPTDGSTAPVSYTTTTSYAQSAADPGGTWPSQVKSPDGVVTTSQYNAAGEVTQSTDGAGNATTYNYDVLGRQVQTTNPDGTYDTVTYDPAGNKVAQASYSAPPSGSTAGTLLASTTATYDGEGNQLSATDARGDSSTFTYDAAGDQTAETQPVTVSTGIVTSFGYDAGGNQTRYTDGNGNNWLTTYNSWNLAKTQVEPATSQYTTTANTTTTIGYDADGRESTVTEPGGVALTNTYDSMGDLMTQTGSGTVATTANRSFTYDADGSMKTASTTAAGSSPATTESFTYDDRGNLVSATGAAGSTTVSWNGDSETTAVQDAAGRTTTAPAGCPRWTTRRPARP